MDAMEIRRNAIVELVNKYGTVSFSQIKEQFSNVSEMTLRTDLKALDEAKEIVKPLLLLAKYHNTFDIFFLAQIL